CSQHALPFDLHHARPAVPVRPHAGHITKTRDLDPILVSDFEDRLIGIAAHGRAVQNERDRRSFHEAVARLLLHYSTSSGKYFNTVRTGLGAAWPKPQIDASIMACDNSCSRGASHRRCSINSRALTVPTRHGVHWPQDSSAKNFITLRAASAAVS